MAQDRVYIVVTVQQRPAVSDNSCSELDRLPIRFHRAILFINSASRDFDAGTSSQMSLTCF